MAELSLQEKADRGVDVALALLKAWRLPPLVTRLEIVFDGSGQPPRVRVEFYPDPRAEPLVTLAREYTLVPRDEPATLAAKEGERATA